MGKSELILVLGGLMLLSTFTLSLNRYMVQDQRTLYQSEHVLNAMAIAQQYIEKAEATRFDEDKAATIPSSFTYANNLGPDSGEQYPYFDDVDDFDGFSIVDTLAGYIPYTINISVKYVTLANPDVVTSTRTYFKRMVVQVSSPYLSEFPSNTIELKKLFTYHYFYNE
ncbi:MAG: hypothetical protein SCK70_01895 [bacterium]|nr:hypothetical protein [bacterium]